MINWAILREPWNWFVVGFALLAWALIITQVHPMTRPQA
jgi:hypothetical protein